MLIRFPARERLSVCLCASFPLVLEVAVGFDCMNA